MPGGFFVYLLCLGTYQRPLCHTREMKLCGMPGCTRESSRYMCPSCDMFYTKYGGMSRDELRIAKKSRHCDMCQSKDVKTSILWESDCPWHTMSERTQHCPRCLYGSICKTCRGYIGEYRRGTLPLNSRRTELVADFMVWDAETYTRR